MNFLKLTACNEDGKEAGYIFVNLKSALVVEKLEHCSRIVFPGGWMRFIKEEPEDIIK